MDRQPGPFLDAKQPRTSVKVEMRRIGAAQHEKRFDFIEQQRSSVLGARASRPQWAHGA
jgi:hypothetical protein